MIINIRPLHVRPTKAKKTGVRARPSRGVGRVLANTPPTPSAVLSRNDTNNRPRAMWLYYLLPLKYKAFIIINETFNKFLTLNRNGLFIWLNADKYCSIFVLVEWSWSINSVWCYLYGVYAEVTQIRLLLGHSAFLENSILYVCTVHN